jgi:hypothetical protein
MSAAPWAWLLAGALGANAAAPTVMVQALPRPDGGVLYRYRVCNPGPGIIVGLVISSADGNAQAGQAAPPLPDARDSAVPDAPPAAPAGWRGIKLTTEEMSYVHVVWRGSRQTGIQPGLCSAAFDIATPRPNPLYLHVRWSVEFDGARTVSGQL